MESSALLANVAVILAKDILIDENIVGKDLTQQYPLYNTGLDDSGNMDEAESFFLKQNFTKNMHRKFELKSRKRNRTLNTSTEVNLLNLFEGLDFQRNVHMQKATFQKIFKHLDFLKKNHSISGISAETTFSLAIWKLTTDEHFEQLARRFSPIPFFICQNTIRQFWTIMSQKNFIEFPMKMEKMLTQMQDFEKHAVHQKLPNLCGIIALKRLDIFLESSDEEVQIIFQIIIDSKQKVLDCFVNLLTDYSFESSPIGRVLETKGLKPPHSYLIGDKNFPLKPYLITPFTPVVTEKETAFNDLLEQNLSIAQNCFDIMAMRFNSLYLLESKDLFEVRRIIMTICALHNLCVQIGDDVESCHSTVKQVNWTKPAQLDISRQCERAALIRRDNVMNEVIKI